MSHIVCLIPSFNAKHTIAEVVVKCRRVTSFVVVYDDGSTDCTAEIAEACGAIVIQEKINYGKGYALKQLFEYMKNHKPEMDHSNFVVVTLDSDMQHDPEDIPKLIDEMKKTGAEIVVDSRTKKSKFRTAGGKILNGFSRKEIDMQSGFRAYCWQAILDIEVKELGFGVDQQILDDLIEKGYRNIRTVKVGTKYDEYSHTQNPAKHFLEVLSYNFLRKPLRSFGILGIFGVILGTVFIFQVVHSWTITKELALGTFLFAMLSMILGSFVFFVGLILHVLRSRR